MDIKIDKEVFKKLHSELKMGLIHLEGINNQAKVEESRHLLKEITELINLTFNKDTIKTHELISPWEVVKEEFGSGAKHYQTSLEKLLRAVLAGKNVLAANTLTNLVRYLSLKHLIPLAVDDLDEVEGNLNFKISQGGEKMSLIWRLKKNVLYYRDDRGILGAKLDFWKDKRTAVGPETTGALIHIEAIPPITGVKLAKIMKDIMFLARTFCKGKGTSLTLDRRRSKVKI
ncbi:MAG TPA: phenylalanine--tRNA ligase beta subunit-related protein [Candidatus Nanoarchaeia archaeon]|nr:phenylalanine--tRNA ligase beta subunit-related protein [Candidatus Nanoarchaeia archaeon]